MCSYGNIRLEANSIHWPFVLCFADNFGIDPSNHRSTRIKIISTMRFCHSIAVLRQISCRQSCTEEVSWCDTTYLDAMLIGPSKGVSRYHCLPQSPPICYSFCMNIICCWRVGVELRDLQVKWIMHFKLLLNLQISNIQPHIHMFQPSRLYNRWVAEILILLLE